MFLKLYLYNFKLKIITRHLFLQTQLSFATDPTCAIITDLAIEVVDTFYNFIHVNKTFFSNLNIIQYSNIFRPFLFALLLCI